MADPEVTGPMMAATRSWVIIFVARLTASVESLRSSPAISSTVRSPTL